MAGSGTRWRSERPASSAASWPPTASPVADPTPAETVFPLAELDRMLPRCDAVLVTCALAPETRGLIDARRLALIPAVALPVAP